MFIFPSHKTRFRQYMCFTLDYISSFLEGTVYRRRLSMVFITGSKNKTGEKKQRPSLKFSSCASCGRSTTILLARSGSYVTPGYKESWKRGIYLSHCCLREMEVLLLKTWRMDIRWKIVVCYQCLGSYMSGVFSCFSTS